MPFSFTRLDIPEVILIEPKVFPDGRGFFMETFKHSDFSEHGIEQLFVQENQSQSLRSIVRGLHFQRRPRAQGKLVRVLSGEIFDVAVDIRRGSPSFGKWIGIRLSGENKKMLYIPPWCAHGFCVISEEASVVYMVTEEYAPECEGGILWSDPDLSIQWPIEEAVVSERDQVWPRLREAETGFVYEGLSNEIK